MDAYSRKFVGWHLDKTMEAQSSLKAFEMAILSRGKSTKTLIHHSDSGVQCCSRKYVDRLRDHGVTNSMTQSGDANENAMAERLFRTLKGDFEIRGFISFASVDEAVEKAINNYNAMRLSPSQGYLTPHQAHYRIGPLPLKWYPYKKIRFENVQYPDHYQKTG